MGIDSACDDLAGSWPVLDRGTDIRRPISMAIHGYVLRNLSRRIGGNPSGECEILPKDVREEMEVVNASGADL